MQAHAVWSLAAMTFGRNVKKNPKAVILTSLEARS
jgi:hypothetical protein